MKVVDFLEVIDVEHEKAQVAQVTTGAHELLAVEGLEQVAFDVDLRATIVMMVIR